MQIANLGDSGFRVFRDAKCLFASEVISRNSHIDTRIIFDVFTSQVAPNN
jgi:hypothetical protein